MDGVRIFAALGDRPAYAIVDGARDPRIRGWVKSSRAPAWCLYRGELPREVEDVAPWLVRIAPGYPHTEELLERGWSRSWGILLSSSAPSRELRRHLRRFLLCFTEQKRKLLFRYYDPRVLRAYLPSCDETESAAFFGPVSTFIAADRRAPEQMQVFHAPAHKQPPPRVLVISDAQLEILGIAARENLIESIADEPRTRAIGGLGEVERLEKIDAALDRAQLFGIVERDDRALFAQLALAHGLEFEQSEDLAWTRPLLENEELPGNAKMTLILSRLPPRLLPWKRP